MSTRRMLSIQIMRIVACIGVFNGHFLGLTLQSKTSLHFLTWLRNGWVSRTPLCVLFQGDTNISLFLVIAGFLQAFGWTCTSWRRSLSGFCYRYLELMVPTIIVTILCGISLKVQEMFRVGGIEFEVKTFVSDILIVLIKGGTPTYSYHLWYMRDLVKCIFLAMLFLKYANDKYKKIVLYIVALVFFAFTSTTCFAYFSGMIVGEITEMYRNRENSRKGKWKWIAIGSICLFLFPFVFNEDHLQSKNVLLLSICFATLLLATLNLEKDYKPDRCKKCYKVLSFLDKNTFSFYLLHVFVFRTFSYNVFNQMKEVICVKEEMHILVTWIVSVVICLMISNIFTKYVLGFLRKKRRDIDEGITL